MGEKLRKPSRGWIRRAVVTSVLLVALPAPAMDLDEYAELLQTAQAAHSRLDAAWGAAREPLLEQAADADSEVIVWLEAHLGTEAFRALEDDQQMALVRGRYRTEYNLAGVLIPLDRCAEARGRVRALLDSSLTDSELRPRLVERYDEATECLQRQQRAQIPAPQTSGPGGPEPRAADHPAGASYLVGVKLGGAFGGTLYNEQLDADFDVYGGFLFELDGALRLSDHFSIGAFLLVNFASVEPGAAGWDDDGLTFVVSGFKLRLHLAPTDALRVRPAMAIGVNAASSDSAWVDGSVGLGLGLHVELVYRLSEAFALVLEPGFFSQPFGGNEETVITWAPIFFLAAGVELGGW
jgi:hypothetical protein